MAEVEILQFKKLTKHAYSPSRGSQHAAGLDLKSAYNYIVPSRGVCLIKTDIQIKLPSGTYGRIAARSGLALKHKIDVGAGVIDCDYRGNIGIILFNHGEQDFNINPGDRIAQLICERCSYPSVEEVSIMEITARNMSGFGSSGI